jgi:hypothetical protein
MEDWLAGKARVMVATVAFGMGIDKVTGVSLLSSGWCFGKV